MSSLVTYLEGETGMLVKLIEDIEFRITVHQCQAIQRLEYGQIITKAHKTQKT